MNEFRVQQKLMGSAFELVVYSEDETVANRHLENGINEIKRIEKLLSEFDPGSVTSLINRNAGIKGVQVTPEVFDLIGRCLKISQLTQGAFDITTGPLKKLYDFKRKEIGFPSQQMLDETLEKIGSNLIHIGKGQTVYLTRQGMAISFASIGKGYAADRVKYLWKSAGVRSGLINASGDLCAIGSKPDRQPWKVGIPDPENQDRILLSIPVIDGAVATSGDYEQYFHHEGKRYGHTLNPATGLPVSWIKSVSIKGNSAELCDALATSVTVMGIEAGLHLLNQLPDTHGLIIDKYNKLHFSKNITFEKTK
ncbi:MAG: FAD:protein FMN transferase [Bacteroidales bacterium]|nr:FAD:protein FMN transferase [Bacteroidales bacterium]